MTADGDGALEPDDLERVATAGYLVGRDRESEGFRERAHHAYLERGDPEGAARSAFWLSFQMYQRGAIALASGWQARSERLLNESHLDSVVGGYLLIPSAIRDIVAGNPASGHAVFSRIAEIASRFDDRDLRSVACHGQGRALIRLGRTEEGVARLDEAMVAVITGEVSPLVAGDVYCSVLEGCQEIFDLRRAYEWTTSLARWCDTQPDLVRYRGECLLYRAEVMQLYGRWHEAAEDARAACALLDSRPAAGAAFYRLGEIHRLCGELEQAETAYGCANDRGRRPQPGLSLLRLAQRRIEAATASIRALLTDIQGRPARARALAAAVDILLAAGDVEHARAAAAELAEIASTIGSSLLAAQAAHAMGATLFADGDVVRAATSLRTAAATWRDLGMPYEEAQTCLLLATVCDRRGDEDGRRLEMDRARGLLARIHLDRRVPLLEIHDVLANPKSLGPLSDRESQVLRLLATGQTNRDIAGALFISEKTVARHVSNIFDKLGVSTRTEAAAWAYRQKLI